MKVDLSHLCECCIAETINIYNYPQIQNKQTIIPSKVMN